MTVEWKRKKKKERKEGRKGRLTMGDDGLLQFACIFLCFAFRPVTADRSFGLARPKKRKGGGK